MCFWKVFAVIALGWALIKHRGAILVGKRTTAADGTESPKAQSGKGWRLVSSKKLYPGRKVQAPSQSSEEAATPREAPDRSGERE